MATFAELWDRRRAAFARELRDRAAPREAAALLSEALDRLLAESLAGRETSLPERRALGFAVDAARASAEALSAAGRAEVLYRAPAGRRRRSGLGVRMLQGLLAALALGALWELGAACRASACAATAVPLWTWIAGGLFAGAAALELRFVLPRRAAPGAPPEAEALVRADPDALAEALGRAAASLDKLAADLAGRSEPEPAAFALAEDGPLLDFLHDLSEAGETGDAAYALAKARSLPALLALHGVACARPAPGEAPDPRTFDASPGLDPAQRAPVLLRPAFVRGGRPLRRGAVLLPAGGA